MLYKVTFTFSDSWKISESGVRNICLVVKATTQVDAIREAQDIIYSLHAGDAKTIEVVKANTGE